MRKYFAIIVHYGNPQPTHNLIDSLLFSTGKVDRIIVVDHAKEPYAPTDPHPKIHLIRPVKNTGYAGGINIGLGYLSSQDVSFHDIVMYLNNDLKIQADTVAKLKKWWSNHSESAIAGIKYGAVNLVTGRTKLTSYQLPATSYQLRYLHGSFLSGSLEIMLKLQGLPNQYFLYWEDVLFSHRAFQMGIQLKVIPSLVITHDDTLKEKYSDEQLYYLVRNGALFLSQETNSLWKIYWHTANRLRFFYHSLRPDTSQTKVIKQALQDAIHNRTGKR